MQRKMERGVCWGLDKRAEKNGEEWRVLGIGQTCRRKKIERGVECTGDWTDMQKNKMERAVECTGDWTGMQRKMERGVFWGLDRHAEKTGEKERETEAGGWRDMQRKW